MFTSMTGKNFVYGVIGGVASEVVLRWIDMLPGFLLVPMIVIAIAGIGGAVFAYSAASQYDTQNIWPSRSHGELILTISFVSGIAIFVGAFYIVKYFLG